MFPGYIKESNSLFYVVSINTFRLYVLIDVYCDLITSIRRGNSSTIDWERKNITSTYPGYDHLTERVTVNPPHHHDDRHRGW